MYAAQGGNTSQYASKDDNRWKEDHVRHQDNIPAHVGQDRTELVQTTARGVLGDLIFY